MADLRDERERAVRTKTRELGPVIAGLGGAAVMRTRLYISNQNGEELAEIQRVRSVSYSCSVSSNCTWNCTISMDRDLTWGEDKIRFNPYIHWIKMDAEVLLEDGWRTYPRGLYKFDAKSGTHSGPVNTWDLSGYSPEFVLVTDGPEKVYKLKKGDKLLHSIRDKLEQLGFERNRIKFPMSEEVELDKGVVFDPNQDTETEGTWQDVFSKLLTREGFIKIYADHRGILRTATLKDVENDPPSIVYGTTLDAEPILIEGIEDNQDTANFCNRVVVTSEDPKQKPPIYAVAKSKRSFHELGNRWVTTRIKQKGIKNNDIARKMAKAYLKRYMRFTQVISYSTPPDPERQTREFHRFKFAEGTGPASVDGVFRNMYFEQDMYPNPKAMTFTSVRRVDD